MKSGIYMIKNNLNEKFYIGSTKNLNVRFSTHKSLLKKNKHTNIHLQRSYNKYGDVFSYIILEYVNEEKLLEIEQKYLDRYKNNKLFYNISLKSLGGDNISNHPDRDKIIIKIKKALHRRYNNMSKEERKKLSINRLGNKNPNYGNKWTIEMKKNISEKLKNYYKTHKNYKKNKTFEEIYGNKLGKELKKNLSECAKKRIGEKNGFFGKHHNDKTKKILSEKRKNKYYGHQNIPFYIDNLKYNSLGEASKKLGIHRTTIRFRLNSLNEKFNNYKYK